MHIELIFLGFFISKRTLKMDPKKVEAIINWPTPKIVGEVRSFHGLVIFYRKKFKNFSHICACLLDTIKGGNKTKFQWITQVDEAFEYLKGRVE